MPIKPFRDSQGRLRLDARIRYQQGVAVLEVCVRIYDSVVRNAWMKHMREFDMTRATRAELCDRLRGMVFATVVHYGGPYKLRSKIR